MLLANTKVKEEVDSDACMDINNHVSYEIKKEIHEFTIPSAMHHYSKFNHFETAPIREDDRVMLLCFTRYKKHKLCIFLDVWNNEVYYLRVNVDRNLYKGTFCLCLVHMHEAYMLDIIKFEGNEIDEENQILVKLNIIVELSRIKKNTIKLMMPEYISHYPLSPKDTARTLEDEHKANGTLIVKANDEFYIY